MEQLHQEGHVRALGISNVNLPQLKELYEQAQVKPSFAQIRCYARNLWDRDIRTYCNEYQIIYQGFSLLTDNSQVMSRPEILEIAARIKATIAQVVFSFARQVGMLPLTGTSDAEHMKQDLAARDLELSPREIETIAAIASR